MEANRFGPGRTAERLVNETLHYRPHLQSILHINVTASLLHVPILHGLKVLRRQKCPYKAV